MSVSIIKAGVLDTIQDLGRFGYASWGIASAGAMDRYAAQVANLLVGNCRNDALIEMHFPGPQILFEQTTLIAVTGGDFAPSLNGNPIPLWQPLVVRKNTMLLFSQLRSGARCYLAIHGGLDLNCWLGSYSTHLRAGAGGLDGKRLEKQSVLRFKESRIYYPTFLREESDFTALSWGAVPNKVYEQPNVVWCIPGREWQSLPDESKEIFQKNFFIIQPASDRMGYQLSGTDLSQDHRDLISSAVSFGTIQLLPSGQMIILMADHQATGGYPRIAHVISAHLPKLAQLRPGDSVEFRLTDVDTAEELLLNHQLELRILERSSRERFNLFV